MYLNDYNLNLTLAKVAFKYVVYETFNVNSNKCCVKSYVVEE
ncbi:hypothetical protein CSCA_0742 [Clostridium scatologenes]|uniref:Uncharacterized protein n=1 Tax=Clostridium scatologenes TaxID=1548 RepID=A0A0E3JMB6_CLOSL|nr:hypothetical protein CSCA_0742 [Clostridium scatologenes]